MRHRFLFAAASLLILAACAPKDGTHRLYLLTTNDVHGCFFDSTYVGGGVKRSLCAVKTYVDEARAEYGADNVLLIDAGDCLQGDNAAYYYNYVDTVSTHIYPRMAAYVGYDVCTVGNHDIETGHPVYDRVAKDMKRLGIPYLAGNVIDTATGKPYFQTCAILRKAGLKVAVLGYTNANMKAWLDEGLWEGLDFVSLTETVQKDVDDVIAKQKPQVVIVSVHSGTGNGDGTQLESQGKDLMKTLKGVDFLVCSHDHSPLVLQGDGISLINSGSHARYLGNGILDVEISKGKVVSKTAQTALIPVDASRSDAQMHREFGSEYQAVKDFTLNPVGALSATMYTRDSFRGMCPYINLIHTVCLGVKPAVISLAAPLTYNGVVNSGVLVYNDLFTIYPYENQLFVVKMTGKEIKDYLEFSYDGWINTISSANDHVLKISPRDDPRTGQEKWSFVNRTYNFDSAAGINYTVDVTKPSGSRVSITTLANGDEFSMDAMYPVAMTSYRASGGGGLVPRGAGVSAGEMKNRIVRKCPEIRNLIYGYLNDCGGIDPSSVSNPSVIGSWSFVPETMCSQAIERDWNLLFGK